MMSKNKNGSLMKIRLPFLQTSNTKSAIGSTPNRDTWIQPF
jgi:hypothetical protein